MGRIVPVRVQNLNHRFNDHQRFSDSDTALISAYRLKQALASTGPALH